MSADLKNLSIEELKKIDKLRTQELKNKYNQYKQKQEQIEKQKLIERINKKESLKKKISLSTKNKPKIKRKPRVSNPKNKQKFQPKTKPKTKTFDDYFQECIQNKTIPPDTPSYLRKALERAIIEHEQGIVKEKSALDEFANKFIVKGKPGILPFEFFKSKSSYLKKFLRNHRNIKVRFVLVCLMEKVIFDDKWPILFRIKHFFIQIHILILNQPT